jgi:DNA-binding NarL/FixJ family response regulator
MHAAIEIALDAGEGELASDWLKCHDRWIAWSGNIPFATIGHRLWSRYYRAIGDDAAAWERANQALTCAMEPRQPLALLAAHRLLGELNTVRGAYDRAHQHLATALAVADGCQAPFERGLTLVAASELAVARGVPYRARLLLTEARTICEALGANPTLERVSALEARVAVTAKPSYPAGLSAREVEVLQLVAQGLTDAEVAGRLFLSPRTVSQHLRSVYNKLGVNSRTAATRFAIEHRLG